MFVELFQVASTLIVASVPSLLVANLTGQGTYMEWTVRKTRTPSPDVATIRVFNLHRAKREALRASAKIPGPVFVALAIGWRGICELVFGGEVWSMRAEDRVGDDVISHIEAGAGAKAQRDTPPSGVTTAGTDIGTALTLMLANLGWSMSPAALALVTSLTAAAGSTPVQLTGGMEATEVLDVLFASIGLSWSLSDNNIVVVYQYGQRVDLPATLLAPTTGLLEWSPTDDGGTTFKALARPDVQPGGAVTVMDPYGKLVGDGFQCVDELTFEGTSSGPSTMTGVTRPIEVL